MKAVILKDISKKFILAHQRERLSKGVFSSVQGKKVSTEFWALKDINMEIDQGKVIGVIGRNGAGKTTLLNLLAGIATPTTGKIEICGRVSSLLTLGAGFQDELTGEENIYLNSSIIGMGRNEINKKYQSIVEFSELDGFLDSPLHTYSQGMRLRLGFSIAAHMDFDILLTDEILSVGDVSFQKKCFDKIEEFKKQNRTMIITSHDIDTINRICDEIFLLENGQIVQRGGFEKVSARYLELLKENSLPATFRQRYGKTKWWADKRSWEKKEGSKEIRIVEVKTFNAHGKQTNIFKENETVRLEARFIAEQEVQASHFGVAIFREDGAYCYGPNTLFDNQPIEKVSRGEGFFSIEYKSLSLRPGDYRFSAAVWDSTELWAYDYHVGFYKFKILGDNKHAQLLNLRYSWEQLSPGRKFSIFPFTESGGNLDPEYKLSDQIVPCDLRISTVQLLDALGNPRVDFDTGDDLKIKIEIEFLKSPHNYYLWVGIFRSDDIYCHGASRKLKEKVNILHYPGLPLLTGDYYLSVGVWEKDRKEPLVYQYKISNFKIVFSGQDHGTVYLEHVWKWQLPFCND
ncbi:MAG: Wzt carbohydrate-binding domain-containing protein [Candidatus Omnitrophica bacterium]|nr:Wzt carbohydrate-binding domain-containing protein [Candidatus Omnitrophota bacterium]